MAIGVAVVVAAAPAAASSAARSERESAAAAQTVTLAVGQKVYRASGNQGLGTLRLKRTAALTWRHVVGGRFRLLTSAGRARQFPLVTTVLPTGSVRLRAGSYRGLLVQARGDWRLTITTLKR